MARGPQRKPPGEFNSTPKGQGVYRVEGWLTVDTEERPWIYANPIYVR